jgi:hypothetical protein
VALCLAHTSAFLPDLVGITGVDLGRLK